LAILIFFFVIDSLLELIHHQNDRFLVLIISNPLEMLTFVKFENVRTKEFGTYHMASGNWRHCVN
jgi:hypothetical protein